MYKSDQWQPWGCMMHKYTRTDTERCFRYNRFWGSQNHLVFIGKNFESVDMTKKLLFLDNFLKTIVFLTYFNIFTLQPFSFRVGLTNLK